MATNAHLLNCPPLRFPEFNDEWKKTTLGKVLSIGSGKDYKHLSYGNIPVFGTGGYMTSVNKALMNGESVFIGRKGTIDKPFYYNGEFWTVDTLFYTHSYRDAIPKFILYIANNIHWLEYNEASGVPSLSRNTIQRIPISLPSLPEQRKIATFLSLIDERIETQRQTISHLYSLSMGFYQCIRNKRKAKWSKVFLRDVMTIRKEKNSKNAEVHSVSVKRGIINQIEHLGRSFAAKDTKHYNLVYNGDLVYTKSPTGQFPFGIVKQSFIKKPVAVSPLYGVYIPTNIYVGRIIHSFFLSSVRASSYLASLVQKGAKNTMNITTEHFLDNEIYLPTNIEEQRKIAELFTIFDERIEVEEALLACYETQKRYLLRQMFI